MIHGVGIDVVDIDRFKQSLERTPGLEARLFTETERIKSIQSLAARFAAKEAFIKALSAENGILWHEAEVVNLDFENANYSGSENAIALINAKVYRYLVFADLDTIQGFRKVDGSNSESSKYLTAMQASSYLPLSLGVADSNYQVFKLETGENE